jgi:thymidine phosphorylase
MFQIQKNVPLVKAIRTALPIRWKYPFHEMEVGDMFFVPNKTKNTLATHASTVGRKLGRKFETRLTHMNEVKGQWVPCDADAKDAVTGIGVWRTE